MATDTDIEFRASDLIGSAGIGGEGERLVSTLLEFYPPALQAAQLKRINPVLDQKLTETSRAQAAKIAGVKEIAAMHVRGGDRHPDDAIVTYVFLDEKGTAWKGCFPYNDLGKGESKGHVSQRDSLAASAAGQAHAAAHPKTKAPVVDDSDLDDALDRAEEAEAKATALAEQNAELEAKLEAAEAAKSDSDAPPAGDPMDLLAFLSDAHVDELQEYMQKRPDLADTIKAIEVSNKGEKARKGVIEFEPKPDES